VLRGALGDDAVHPDLVECHIVDRRERHALLLGASSSAT
jgi:hypothetical protein